MAAIDTTLVLAAGFPYKLASLLPHMNNRNRTNIELIMGKNEIRIHTPGIFKSCKRFIVAANQIKYESRIIEHITIADHGIEVLPRVQ